MTATGDYSAIGVVECRLDPFYAQTGTCGEDDPRLVNNFLAKRIGQLLETANEPVIVVDVGGEFGVTAAQLAGQYADAIDSNYLAVAVTNLAPTLQGHEHLLDPKVVDSVQEIRARAGSRVQSITSNALELPNQMVTLKNGTEIPLRGKVALAHENASVRYWSLTPGIDAWRASQIVARNGLYMVDEVDCLAPHIVDCDDHPTYIWYNERVKENAAVREEMGRLGLSEITFVESGTYAWDRTFYLMIKGPEALPIDV